MNLREIHITDAEAYLDLLETVEAESPYALLEADERRTTIRDLMYEIEEVLAQPNQTILVVEDRDLLVGWVGAFGERYRRVQHAALVGVGVREAYHRQGIGTWLFTELETWAWQQGIRRLELVVHTENRPAIGLYRKMGFQIEGTKRASYCLDGRDHNEYLMAKLLHKETPPPHNPPHRW